MIPYLVGQRVPGFANGLFGRDSYNDRVIEAQGAGWIVTRSVTGEPEFLELTEGNWYWLKDILEES